MTAVPTAVAPAGDYKEWKSWQRRDFFVCSARQRSYFDRELSDYDFQRRQVLEVGFGNGELLCWLADRGAIVHGFEIDGELVDAARCAGVAILDPAQPADGSAIDYILAFDVFEHLTRAQLVASLVQFARLLTPDGAIVARFPNAQSPFSTVYQHGDATHQGAVSAAILAQLAREAGLELTLARRPRIGRTGGLLRRIASAGRDLVQRAIEGSLALVYAFDAPLAPNVLVELRRMPAAKDL